MLVQYSSLHLLTLAGTHWEHRILESLNVPGMVLDEQIVLEDLRLRVNYDGTSPDMIHECKTYKWEKGFKVPKKYIQQVNLQNWVRMKKHGRPFQAEIVAYGLQAEDYKNYLRELDPSRRQRIPVVFDQAYFALYSTARKDSPVMYACKGDRADYEYQILTNVVNEGGYLYESTNGSARPSARILNRIGSFTNQKTQHHNRPLGTGGNNGNAPTHSRNRRMRPSAAFKNCIKNIEQVQQRYSLDDHYQFAVDIGNYSVAKTMVNDAARSAMGDKLAPGVENTIYIKDGHTKDGIRSGMVDKVAIGTDFFDASINRVIALSLGVRNTKKAILEALLEPTDMLKKLEREGQLGSRLAYLEELKTLPFGSVWDEFCHQCDVPTGKVWIEELENYERDVLLKRV